MSYQKLRKYLNQDNKRILEFNRLFASGHVKRKIASIIYGVFIIILFTGCDVASDSIVGRESYSKKNLIIETDSNTTELLEKKQIIKEVDYSDSFKGINGCAVFYNVKQNSYDIYNLDLCKEQISPYSTFKIISTLMGLSKDIFSNVEFTQSVDVTLQEAFKKSYVWYFEKVMSLLERDYVQKTLENIGYGNTNLSVWEENNHNKFWIASSLKISSLEQVEVLSKLFEDDRYFTKNVIEQVEDLMLVEENDYYSVYGKTGSASKKDAWFVGFFKKETEKTYFAVRIADETQKVAGKIAQEIAIDIINKYITE